jgi:hypothetical protein
MDMRLRLKEWGEYVPSAEHIGCLETRIGSLTDDDPLANEFKCGSGYKHTVNATGGSAWMKRRRDYWLTHWFLMKCH